nr:unnamed protein product [Callosobruchus chinensis]
MFKPGSVRKVEVKDFVTYSFVEMYPGPHLNMLIGPNGTGKSTIVAAIILGLGGSPKTVGRGHKISEYVKRGCERATINIYLQGNEENRFHKITREFDFRDRSAWKLDNRSVKLEDVLNFIKEYNIQVDNLCQFLPQDKVQDFAKLNKQELLKETQKALCRFDLLEKQEQLIEYRAQHVQLHESLDKHNKKLQEAEQANSLLEGRVQSFNKKKEFDLIIQNIDRKVAWRQYEGIKDQLMEIKSDRNEAQKVCDRYKDMLKPAEQKITRMKKEITDKQQDNNRTKQIIKTVENSLNTNFEKVEGIKHNIQNITDDMNGKLAEMEQWQKEIENAMKKLDEMKELQKQFKEKCASNSKAKQTLTTELNKLASHQKSLQNRKEEILQTKQDSIIQMRGLQNEISRLGNVKQRRLQYLQRINPDAYKAVNWLENNRHLFEDQIFDPMMLEINVLNNQHSKYVENVVSVRDRLAFTCVNKRDMNKLIKCLRESQKLSVNVIHSDYDPNQGNRFQPNIPIEKLRKFGFYTYVNNLFTAPEPIMHYLCKTYHLHNIPIGDQTTDQCYDEVPPQIRNFFGDKCKYIISYSRYTNEKSTKLTQVYSDGALSLSMDIVKMDQLKGQIEEIQRSIQNYENECATVDGHFKKIQEKVETMRNQQRAFQKEQQDAAAVESRIATTERKIREMQQSKKTPEEIQSEAKAQARAYVKNMESIQVQIKNETEKFCELSTSSTLQEQQIEVFRKMVAYMENEISENKRKLDEAEQQLNVIKDKYNEVASQAKSLQSRAKGLSKGFLPSDEGFDEFREQYDALPNDVEQLKAKKEQYASRIACLNIADDGELQE